MQYNEKTLSYLVKNNLLFEADDNIHRTKLSSLKYMQQLQKKENEDKEIKKKKLLGLFSSIRY